MEALEAMKATMTVAEHGALAFALQAPPDLVEAVARRAVELLAAETGGDAEGGFIDVAGAAAFLACPKSRIYALVSAGRIPHHRDGSRLLFDRAELREYVRRGGATVP
jgi:excisionase family DNA binding protein